MSPAMFARIIYDHFLFDLPKLLDLCRLYSSSNQPLLVKMVGHVFERQPHYQEDWRVMVRMLMDGLSETAGKVLRETGERGAVRLDRSTG